MRFRSFVFISFLIISTAVAWAAPPPDKCTIPPALEAWKSWVLHGEEDRFCPTSYNSGETYRCIWPSRLDLDLDRKGGRFSQIWLVFKEGWVPLPGSQEMWPQNVKVDGKAVLVVGKREIPSVHLSSGEHMVDGYFLWSDLPEMIHIPEASGLVSLSINDEPVEFPLLESDGRLWLQKREKSPSQEEGLGVHVYRLLRDSIPMQAATHLKIIVSGQAREIKLEGVLLEGFVPLSIKSSLPARLGKTGELMVQARPGRWEIEVLARSEGQVHTIGPAKMPYGQEIWAFQQENHLRMVKVQGVPSVDPHQTGLPSKWKKFSTFVIKLGDQISFKEIRRGDPDPAPDHLHLKRNWWLDFDGKGLTIQDQINGTMSHQWYLAMNPPAALGRVSVDGRDQLITSQGKEKKPGVELRRGQLNLVAESRFDASTKIIPAVGWDHDFQSVSGFLNLPAGWRLLTARGVDVMPGTWFERWTLLDLFLVLIISLAVFKLWNWRWGILALVTIALTYHESGSPRLVWLNLLAALALLRFLPEGWFRKLVNLWRMGSIVTLLVLAIPFMVQQVRWGVYPQLESPGVGARFVGTGYMDAEVKRPEGTVRRSVTKAKKAPTRTKSYLLSESMHDKLESYERQQQAVLFQDPSALVQTGPGLPKWKWHTFFMKWNGPVNRDQQVRLWLLPPWINLILAFVRVFLLAFLIWCLMGFRQWKLPSAKFTFTTALLCMLLLWGPAAGAAKNDGFPPAELLKELRERLLEKQECLPRCAESPRMELTANPADLRILLEVHAVVKTAIPLPGSLETWRPHQVILDSQPVRGLARDSDGSLWVLVPEGIHQVTMIGSIQAENVLQIPLPLKPHRVTIQSQGWDIEGVDNNGRVKASIKLIRQENSEARQPAKATLTLPPFLNIERVLSLGQDWQVLTTVRRATPPGAPIVLSVPLIPGESVTTAGIRVEKEKAFIHMEPSVKEIRWNSTLKRSTIIRLKAPRFAPWTESWILDASPIWHCELSGIPIIHHQDQSGHWRPQWRPWPGEGVKIEVSRPEAVPGQILTIDEVKLTYTPGQRFNNAALSLKMRSSQGGQHKISLPDRAKLQWVRIEGKGHPIKEGERDVVIPLRPGGQTVEIEWHQGVDSSLLIKGPQVSIGKEAVNANVSFQMPKSRWILMTGGPRLGPAVLFWTYLIVVILAAVGLGRVNWTPLRTRHWLLLGLGLTQVHPLVAIMIVGWLLALGFRKKHPSENGWFSFNLTQVILVAWTIAALIGLYIAIQKGLLSIPDMQISGNGSSNTWLNWTHDRIGAAVPRPWVLALPLFVFRILMLLWALWLAHSLLKWLRWGWRCFGEEGLWRKIVLRKGKEKESALSPPPVPRE
ncbi:MAG: hypothetical protein JSV50_13805 [Desulfobacteraceae bacterium]|nr:MAG: hypothetical protein JSV50_13805 [Desulfobacteraceae bacterium]